jgi:hypothetical protein
MNLPLRGIEADFDPSANVGPNTSRGDLHPGLRADYGLVAKVRKEAHAWLNRAYAGAPSVRSAITPQTALAAASFAAMG